MSRIQLRKSLTNRIHDLMHRRLTNFVNSCIPSFERTIHLCELREKFGGKDMVCLGTGGSAASLNLTELSRYNVMTCTYAPFYLIKDFNVKSLLWVVTYGRIFDYVLQLEREHHYQLDLSDTVIGLPSPLSWAKSTCLDPSVKRFLEAHPEATVYTFERHENVDEYVRREFYKKFCPDNNVIMAGRDNTLFSVFIPLCSIINVSRIYFAGVDLIPENGHFWDPKLVYQSMDGKLLSFPDEDVQDQGFSIISSLPITKKCYLLEPGGSRLQYFPTAFLDGVCVENRSKL